MSLKVKIGKIVYDSEVEPIMIILSTEKDKDTILQMIINNPEAKKLCFFPDSIDENIVGEWMDSTDIFYKGGNSVLPLLPEDS